MHHIQNLVHDFTITVTNCCICLAWGDVLFFFLGQRRKSVTDQCTNLSTRTGQPKPAVPQNLLVRRDVHTCAGVWTPLKKGTMRRPLLRCTPGCCSTSSNQAALTLFCIRTGAVSALALARHLKNSAVSADQRPPVSASQYNKPQSPANSGCVASFVLRACFSATPGRRAAPRLVVPSRRKGDTISVSMDKWAPWNKANTIAR